MVNHNQGKNQSSLALEHYSLVVLEKKPSQTMPLDTLGLLWSILNNQPLYLFHGAN